MQKTRGMAPCFNYLLILLVTLLYLSVFPLSSGHLNFDDGSRFQFGNVQVGGHFGMATSVEQESSDKKSKNDDQQEDPTMTGFGMRNAGGVSADVSGGGVDNDAGGGAGGGGSLAGGGGGVAKARFETNFKGSWKITTDNVGVSAMQLQTMPYDKLVWFDTTYLGPSVLKLEPPGNCPISFERGYPDCYCHAIEYDGKTDKVRQLHVR